MKSKMLLFAIIATTFFSFSCKKEECVVTTYPIEGYWTGTYTLGEFTNDYTFVIEKGGDLIVADGESLSTSTIAYGSWTLVGNVFSGSYTYSGGGIGKGGGGGSTYLLQATWSNDGKLTNGTWGVAPSNLDGGTFSMNRTN
ncbi:MAG: hypothetical protein IPO64_08685 [Bacteroidetes bacterium]|jgi:hypothetical protein|nr:hypothetical protein [Bacteroidota bacterium]